VKRNGFADPERDEQGRLNVKLERCLRVLELDQCTSKEEAHRAYRDLIRVWHPDRFSGDARLAKKADEKVKELNAAYEELVQHLEKKRSQASGAKRSSSEKQAPSIRSTEAAFEYGTRKVLTFCHSLSKAVRVAVKEANQAMRDDKSR
jgi:curved DNA-binding protein CbpA